MNFDYCNGSVYVIKQGDTLYSISRRYNVPLALILRANPYVDIYNLQVGDELCIPESQPIYPDILPEQGPGPVQLPTPGLPGEEYPNVMPGPGPMPLPTPSLPGEEYPNVMPGPGPMPLPTPSLPGENYPNVMPGPGPMPLPTPGLPGENYPNVMPGPGPMPLPTPSLPSNNNQPMYHLIAYVIKDRDTLQKLLDYFGITLADLLRYNDLDGIQLKPGMTIQIPKKSDD